MDDIPGTLRSAKRSLILKGSVAVCSASPETADLKYILVIGEQFFRINVL